MALESLIDEWRLAWRGLRRARGFSAAAVVTLAVGMAGTTSMFALIQGVVLRPLPVSDPERLVAVWKTLPGTDAAHWPFNAAAVELIRSNTRLFHQHPRCSGARRQMPYGPPGSPATSSTCSEPARSSGGHSPERTTLREPSPRWS
jgi:hypothetical protein